MIVLSCADLPFCHELEVQTIRQLGLSRYMFDAKAFVKLLLHASRSNWRYAMAVDVCILLFNRARHASDWVRRRRGTSRLRKILSRQRGKGRGASIGLTICAAIIQAHGEKIKAANGPEGGASVRVTLPLLDDPPPHPRKKAASDV
jgi:hypothetical protein